jgi:hypothetical protein
MEKDAAFFHHAASVYMALCNCSKERILVIQRFQAPDEAGSIL